MTNLDVVNPDGSVPEFNGKDDLQEWIKAITITPKNHESRTYGDYPDWTKDSATLFGHGLMWGTDVPVPLVRGNIYLSINDGKEILAQAVLTQNFVFIHWQSLFKKNAIMIQHDDKIGVEPVSGTNNSAYFYFKDVFLLNGRNSGTIGRTLGQAKCQISGRYTKDLHQNRRTLSFWHSYAAFLGELKENLQP